MNQPQISDDWNLLTILPVFFPFDLTKIRLFRYLPNPGSVSNSGCFNLWGPYCKMDGSTCLISLLNSPPNSDKVQVAVSSGGLWLERILVSSLFIEQSPRTYLNLIHEVYAVISVREPDNETHHLRRIMNSTLCSPPLKEKHD